LAGDGTLSRFAKQAVVRRHDGSGNDGPEYPFEIRPFRPLTKWQSSTPKHWRSFMANANVKPASEKPYDAITLAKKHRISLEEAKIILDEHGDNRKLADKAARRIAA